MIESKPSGYSEGPIPPWVKPQAYDLDAKPRGSQVSLQVLLEECQENIEENTYYFRWVARVLNVSGAQELLKKKITYEPAREKVVMHTQRVFRENKWENRLENPIRTKNNPSNGEETLTFILKDIRSGDVYEWSYSTIKTHVFFTERYGKFYCFESDKPVDKSYIRIIVDPRRPLKVKELHTEVPRIKEELPNGATAYSWEKKNTISISDPDWTKGHESIQVSEYASWSEVVKKKLPLYSLPPQFDPSEEMRKLIDQWNGLPNELDRATAAVRFVQAQIAYLSMDGELFGQKPADPNETLQKRWGCCRDKALLLHGFFKYMNIDSWCVFVNTSGFEHREMILPTPYEFGHVMVKAKIGGKDYWIETTDSFEGGSLKETTITSKQWGLILDVNTQSITPIPQVKLERLSVKSITTFEFISPLEVKLWIDTDFYDQAADRMRNAVSKMDLWDYTSARIEWFKNKYGKIEREERARVKDDGKENIMSLTESYKISLDKQWLGKPFRYFPSLIENLARDLDLTSESSIDFPLWVRESVNVINPYQKMSVDGYYKIENANFTYSSDSFKSTKVVNKYCWSFELRHHKDTVESSEKAQYNSDVEKIFANRPVIKIQRQDQGSRFFHYLFKGIKSLFIGLWRLFFAPKKP